MHEEGYLILPYANGIAVIADTAAGIFYGVQTAKQMITGRGATAALSKRKCETGQRCAIGGFPMIYHAALFLLWTFRSARFERLLRTK